MAQKSVVNGVISDDMQDADDNFTELYTNVAALASGSGVVVSSTDTAVGYLSTKLLAGGNMVFTINDEGENESLTITADALLQDIVELTSGTTWTCPAGVNKIRGRMVGGGGGGSSSASDIFSGASGAGYCEFLIDVTPGVEYIYSVGVGGTGGDISASATTLGTDGTASTFTVGATTYTANGGLKGGDFAGVAGGTAINGDVNIQGQSLNAFQLSSTYFLGYGGGSVLGVGGMLRGGYSAIAEPGYGGGGSSAFTIAYPSSASQDGGAGIIILDLYS